MKQGKARAVKRHQISIIDPFIHTPAVNCYNRLSSLLGFPFFIHHPSANGIKSLQETQNQTDAYIVLGSASHIHQNLPWHRPLAEFLGEALEKRKLVLGICFGHQLMCHFYGSEVDYHNTNQEKFIGVREIHITKKIGDIEAGTRLTLPVAHKQIVKTLSSDLESLGRDPLHKLEYDLVKHRRLPFYGSQPHPEGSGQFCLTEAKMSEADLPLAQKDGGRFILAVFKEQGLLS